MTTRVLSRTNAREVSKEELEQIQNGSLNEEISAV